MKKSILLSCLTLFLTPGVNAYQFGDDWTVAYGKCNVVDSKNKVLSSKWPKHTGYDYIAKAGSKVTVTGDVFYYKTHQDTTGWKDFVIACSILKNGTCDLPNNKNVFYNFLHINAVKLKPGQALKNVQIGTIADLSSKGAASHVHYSKRIGAWDESISYKGALPAKECNQTKTRTSPYVSGPDFQEKFIDPGSPLFKIEK